ncbi:MAG: P-loop NTPase fold protein [Salibacteraceae bacterium]
MTIKLNDIEAVPGNAFKNCKLKREKYADILSQIIDTYPRGFVLAINNKWGEGKTTFIKMWQQKLIDSQYQTVYFNAWENDFEDNPLIALMGELGSLTNESTKPKYIKSVKNAAYLVKNIAPTLLKEIVVKHTGSETLGNLMDGVTKAMSSIFEESVKEYSERKKHVEEFKDSLAHFIADTNQGKPLIFFIDELDRCRPNYAVSVLEQIKHFFSIPDIDFVLSIDKEQLGNAIKGAYGSDLLDTDEYLRRFIDIEYSIPRPTGSDFLTFLIDYFDFNSFYQSVIRLNHGFLSHEPRSFQDICNILFYGSDIPLRQQEKIFSLARLSLKSYPELATSDPFISIFLAFIKINKADFYNDVYDKKLTINDFHKKTWQIISQSRHELYSDLIWLEAALLNSYNNYYDPNNNKEELFRRLSNNEIELTITFDSLPREKENFNKILKNNVEGERGQRRISMDHFLSKLNLLEPFIE